MPTGPNDGERFRFSGHRNVQILRIKRVGIKNEGVVILKDFNQQRSTNQLAVVDRPPRMPHPALVNNTGLH